MLDLVYTSSEGSTWRLGLAVGKKIGNAVQRNRAKRILRAGFRLAFAQSGFAGDSSCDVAPCDVVIVAKQPIAGASSVDIYKELMRFFQYRNPLPGSQGSGDHLSRRKSAR